MRRSVLGVVFAKACALPSTASNSFHDMASKLQTEVKMENQRKRNPTPKQNQYMYNKIKNKKKYQLQ
eukprot:m.30204 g.30204  ORF g.30204 m.30204 type:complete len:67 (+) comp9622_c0_seq1:3040-3240(+)